MAPVVDLTATSEGARPTPVAVRLSLVELAVLSDRAGGVALPFDLDPAVSEASTPSRLQDRLGVEAPSAADQARSRLRAALEEVSSDPAPAAARLTELGLLGPESAPVGEVVRALRVLGAPQALLVLDLAVPQHSGDDRLRSWFAVDGTEVVQLSTASGLVFELAWYDVSGLAAALARAATVEHRDDPSADEADESDEGHDQPEESELLGATVHLPYELFTDGTEAVRRGREDLLAELVRLAPGPTRVGDDTLGPLGTAQLVTRLEEASGGRLRVLVTVPQDAGARRTVGVVSWLRLGDRWCVLVPLRVDGVPTLRLDAVRPADLARSVAPVLAQVVR